MAEYIKREDVRKETKTTMKNALAELVDQAVLLAGRQTSHEIAAYLVSNCVVKLPCAIGTTVFIADTCVLQASVIAIYIDAFGGMFDLDVITNTETVAGCAHRICKDYAFDDIGKTIFYSRAEAENAIRNNDQRSWGKRGDNDENS